VIEGGLEVKSSSSSPRMKKNTNVTLNTNILTY